MKTQINTLCFAGLLAIMSTLIISSCNGNKGVNLLPEWWIRNWSMGPDKDNIKHRRPDL